MQDLRLPYVRLDGSTPVPERLATVDTCVLHFSLLSFPLHSGATIHSCLSSQARRC